MVARIELKYAGCRLNAIYTPIDKTSACIGSRCKWCFIHNLAARSYAAHSYYATSTLWKPAQTASIRPQLRLMAPVWSARPPGAAAYKLPVTDNKSAMATIIGSTFAAVHASIRRKCPAGPAEQRQDVIVALAPGWPRILPEGGRMGCCRSRVCLPQVLRIAPEYPEKRAGCLSAGTC
jgi:hypothetical protein